MVAGSELKAIIGLIALISFNSPAGADDPIVYLEPDLACGNVVLQNENWNEIFSAAVFAESVLWTRAGVPFKDHPKIDGNSVVDTVSQLRSLCRSNEAQSVAELIESFVSLWRSSSATPPVAEELEACAPIEGWHKRGPALAMPQETNLFLTHRDSGKRADGNVHVFYEPRARCSLLLFSDPGSGWPFTANLYALGAEAARAGHRPALNRRITSELIEHFHLWSQACRRDEQLQFHEVMEMSVAETIGDKFPNGLDGHRHKGTTSNAQDCPYSKDGEDSEPLM